MVRMWADIVHVCNDLQTRIGYQDQSQARMLLWDCSQWSLGYGWSLTVRGSDHALRMIHSGKYVMRLLNQETTKKANSMLAAPSRWAYLASLAVSKKTSLTSWHRKTMQPIFMKLHGLHA